MNPHLQSGAEMSSSAPYFISYGYLESTYSNTFMDKAFAVKKAKTVHSILDTNKLRMDKYSSINSHAVVEKMS
jgi:hypothetical protein